MLDFAFIWSHIGLFEKSLILTLEISLYGIVLALLIGLVCACILVEIERAEIEQIDIKRADFMDSRARPSTPTRVALTLAKWLITSYVELSRNTPLLIQLFFLYFALPKLGIRLEAFTCAVIGLAFLGGGYMCESFRAGLSSISKSQVESALSIGLSRLGILRYVVLPQGFGVALPSINANVIFLIKETSVVGVLALADVLYTSKDIIDLYGKTYEALTMLLLMYMIVLLPISLGASALESALRQRL